MPRKKTHLSRRRHFRPRIKLLQQSISNATSLSYDSASTIFFNSCKFIILPHLNTTTSPEKTSVRPFRYLTEKTYRYTPEQPTARLLHGLLCQNVRLRVASYCGAKAQFLREHRLSLRQNENGDFSTDFYKIDTPIQLRQINPHFVSYDSLILIDQLSYRVVYLQCSHLSN